MSLGGSHLAEFRVPVDERSTEGAGLNRSVRSGTTGDSLVWGRYDLVFLNAVMRPLIRLWLEFSVSSWGGRSPFLRSRPPFTAEASTPHECC